MVVIFRGEIWSYGRVEGRPGKIFAMNVLGIGQTGTDL